jgi:hypothetical protein
MLCENWYQWFSPKKIKIKIKSPNLGKDYDCSGKEVHYKVVVKHRTQIHRTAPFKVLTPT